VADIPAAELWAAREASRTQLVDMVRGRVIGDRLRRGDPLAYASAAAEGFDTQRLTIGFARRLATYKRLHLIGLMPERAVALVSGARAVQFVFAGKAHPDDGAGKETVRRLFALKGAAAVAGRAAFLEDYDIPLAGHLVGGCDVWVNLPRPPLEASGTSGMKSVLGGGLQLSVLDGWWAEGYDGRNGWAIDGRVADDHGAQDWRDAGALFDLLEREVVPMFHERDANGVPQRWVEMMRQSLITNGPRFSAARMVREYAERIYGLPGAPNLNGWAPPPDAAMQASAPPAG
jgi:starch phosphorylase